MKVDIYRRVETSSSITGEFWLDGVFECYYLEPARLTPYHPGHPCIQAGTYRVVLTMSPHLGYLCPEVLDVPGRTAIRWHVGNFPKDVLGCCVVGTRMGADFVSNSKLAFDALLRKLRAQEIFAEYHDPISVKSSELPGTAESGVESAEVSANA
ncbi:MAG: DUF5675 family protein [Candidatus Sulfotelmatobacter sp.]